MEERIARLKELIAIQTSEGNWNYDPYMHGMANGMILALSLIKDTEPAFLEQPKKWLHDKVKGKEQIISLNEFEKKYQSDFSAETESN